WKGARWGRSCSSRERPISARETAASTPGSVVRTIRSSSGSSRAPRTRGCSVSRSPKPSSKMPDVYQQAENIVDRLEAELKALKRWDSEPLAPEQYEDMGAFGSNTMSFVQWLQFVLIPRIREIITEREEFPDGS